jgi:hypothetical protein
MTAATIAGFGCSSTPIAAKAEAMRGFTTDERRLLSPLNSPNAGGSTPVMLS